MEPGEPLWTGAVATLAESITIRFVQCCASNPLVYGTRFTKGNCFVWQVGNHFNGAIFLFTQINIKKLFFSTKNCCHYLNLCCFQNKHLTFSIRAEHSVPQRSDILLKAGGKLGEYWKDKSNFRTNNLETVFSEPGFVLPTGSQNCFSCSLPTRSPFFSYKSTSASSCVLWKPHCLSDEQVLPETWTRSQITVSLKQKLLNSLPDSFYHRMIQVSIPAVSTSVSLLPGQISLGFLLIQFVFLSNP